MEIFPQTLISGSSGLVGSALIDRFRQEDVPYATLVRHGAPAGSLSHRSYFWDPYHFKFHEGMRQLNGLRAAIHLSGENVSDGRWTAAKMQRLRESRVRTTLSIVELLGRLDRPPEMLICASAVGYYGDRGEEVLEETSSSGDGFLAKICREWEAVADAARRFGIRVVHLRFGVILATNGGALQKMLPLFRRGLGGTLGNGKQWMSWISLPDVVRAIEFCINRSDLRGPVNVVANPVTNAEFTVSLAAHLHRPAILPVPAFALRLAFGKMADAALLASVRAIPAAMLRSGFVFEHPTLQDALQGILPR